MSVQPPPAPSSERPHSGKERIFTPTFLMATAAMHLYFFAFFSTFTAIPLFLEGRPDWQIGLVVGVFGIPPWITRFLAGRLADRYGRRGTMLTGAAITTLCFACYGLSGLGA